MAKDSLSGVTGEFYQKDIFSNIIDNTEKYTEATKGLNLEKSLEVLKDRALSEEYQKEILYKNGLITLNQKENASIAELLASQELYNSSKAIELINSSALSEEQKKVILTELKGKEVKEKLTKANIEEALSSETVRAALSDEERARLLNILTQEKEIASTEALTKVLKEQALARLAALAKNPLTWVAAIGLAFYGAYKNVEQFGKATQDLGNNLKNLKTDFSDYDSRMTELKNTINDGTKSVQEITEARKQLLELQSEINESYGDGSFQVKELDDDTYPILRTYNNIIDKQKDIIDNEETESDLLSDIEEKLDKITLRDITDSVGYVGYNSLAQIDDAINKTSSAIDEFAHTDLTVDIQPTIDDNAIDKIIGDNLTNAVDSVKEKAEEFGTIIGNSIVDGANSELEKQIVQQQVMTDAFNKTQDVLDDFIHTNLTAEISFDLENNSFDQIIGDGLNTVKDAGKSVGQAFSDGYNEIADKSISDVIKDVNNVQLDASRAQVEQGKQIARVIDDITSKYKERKNVSEEVADTDLKSNESVRDVQSELYKIQQQVIAEYELEKDEIAKIGENAGLTNIELKELYKAQYDQYIDDFNRGKDNSFLQNAGNSIANILYGNNLNRAIAKMQNYSASYTIPVTLVADTKEIEEFTNSLKGISINDSVLSISDNTTQALSDLKKLRDYINSINSMGEYDWYADVVDKQIGKIENVIDKYGEVYNQYVLNDVIFKDEDLTDVYKALTNSYKDYTEAITEGDEDRANAMKKQYVESMHEAYEINNKDAIAFFESLYPEFSAISSSWEFQLKFDANENDLQSKISSAISVLGKAGLNIDDILNYDSYAGTKTEEMDNAVKDLVAIASSNAMDPATLFKILQSSGVLVYTKDDGTKGKIRTAEDETILGKLVYGQKGYGAKNDGGLFYRNKDGKYSGVKEKSITSLWDNSSLEDQKIISENIDEFKNLTQAGLKAGQTISKAWEKALKKLKETKKETKSYVEQLEGVQNLQSGLDILSSIYEDVKNGEDFDYSSILNNEDFKKTFGALDDATEDYKNAYSDFIKVISNSPTEIDKCQDAFNNLASAYIYNSGELKNVTEESKDATVAFLKQHGVVNALEVVESKLATKSQYAAGCFDDLEHASIGVFNSLNDVTSAHYSNMQAAIAETQATEGATVALYDYIVQETIFANSDLKASNKIRAIAQIAGAFGIAADAASAATEAQQAYVQAKKDGYKGSRDDFYNSYANSYSSKFQDQIASKFGNLDVKVNYSPTSSGSSSGSDSDKEFLETIDWIETKIKRLEREIDNLDQTVNATWKNWSERNTSLISEIDKVNKEIKTQQDAFWAYLGKAESVGLSENYKELVRNGAIAIEDITDENLKNQIDEFQTWYEKALDAADAVQDLQDSLAELANTKIENITKEFDQLLSALDHDISMIDKQMSLVEAKGYLSSTKFYTAQNAIVANESTLLSQERANILNAMEQGLAGGISVDSEQYRDWMAQIDSLDEKLADNQVTIAENTKAIRELNDSYFDIRQEQIQRLNSEAEFFENLLSRDILYNDDGSMTNSGWANIGLQGARYNTNMALADEYGKEIAKYTEMLRNDPYNYDLLKRYEELVDAQQDAIEAAQSAIDDIKSSVEESLNKMLDNLQDISDDIKDNLNAQKDLYDYEKNIQEQTQNISNLEKQLTSLSGDDSEENRMRLQELRDNLANAQEELQQTEYERWLSDQQSMLDTLNDEAQEWVTTYLDEFQEHLGEWIQEINTHQSDIKSAIETKATDVGYEISSGMEKLLGNEGIAHQMLSLYKAGFENILTSTNDSVKYIKDYVEGLKRKADAEAAAAAAAQAAQTPAPTPAPAPAPSPAPTPTSSTPSSPQGNGIADVGDRVTLVSGKFWNTSGGAGPYGNSRGQWNGKQVYITRINPGSRYPYHISTGPSLGNGDLGWLELAQLSGYAKGSRRIADEYAWTQENGGEIVRTKDGALLTPTKGATVFTNAQTDALWNLSKNMLSGISTSKVDPSAIVSNNSNGSVELNIQGGISMYGVNDPETFATTLVDTLNNDRKVQRVLQDKTLGLAMGRNSLSSRRY